MVMPRSSLTHGSLAACSRTAGAACRAAISAVVLVTVLAGGSPARAAQSQQDERLVGYNLLAESLSGEASLNWLYLMREVTLKGPQKEVGRLMKRISKISKQRAEELEGLRKLAPDVTASPPPSPLGDAIQNAAKGLGTKEMIFSDKSFDMRFLLLQAQATRMIAVIAEETAKIDPNERRKAWLDELSKEYEALREEIVVAVKACRIGSP